MTKILAVDDEEEIRGFLSEFLTREGYQVVLAASGGESLTMAQRDNPGVILLDVQMPGLNGIDACRGLKAHEKTWHIPVIVATPYRDRVLEAFDAGADDFVTKPFHLEELAVRVKSIVPIQYLTDELRRAAACIGGPQKHLPRLQMEDGSAVDVQRQRRQLPVNRKPRDGQGDMSRGPDDCRHYPDCSRLELLFADPPVGPTSIPLPGDAEPICRRCEHFEPRQER